MAYLFQRLSPQLAKQFGFRPGNQHPRPHLQIKIQKAPAAQQVLQGVAFRPALGQLGQLLLLLRVQGIHRPAPLASCHKFHQAGGIKGGMLHTSLLQKCTNLVQCLARNGRNHHKLSSGRWGSTGVMAAMATSIMESSGSKVVSRWSHNPGALMMRVHRLL